MQRLNQNNPIENKAEFLRILEEVKNVSEARERMNMSERTYQYYMKDLDFHRQVVDIIDVPNIADEARKQMFITAFRATKAVVTRACNLSGIEVVQFKNFYNTDSEFRERIEEIKEERDDFVEGKLLDAIDKGSVPAMIFYAETKLKHRGYVKRKEITGDGGGAVKYNVTLADFKVQATDRTMQAVRALELTGSTGDVVDAEYQDITPGNNDSNEHNN